MFQSFREVLDLSHFAEEEGKYLEGTGSIVFDYTNRIAYTCNSSRTDKDVLSKVCEKLNFGSCNFDAFDKNGDPIYHTNVMMWIGTKVAAVCFDSIANEKVSFIIAS